MAVKMAEPKAQQTKAQKALDLKAKLEQLTKEAEDEALEGINEHLATLAQLGKPHVVIPKADYEARQTPNPAPQTAGKRGRPPGTAKAPKAAPGPSSKYDSSKTCEKCGGLAGHSVKAHNLAGDFKDKKFSDDELKNRGYWPPEGAPAQQPLQ